MSRGSKKDGKKASIISLGLGGRSKSRDDDTSSTIKPIAEKGPGPKLVKGLDQSLQIRSDSMGYNPDSHHHDDVKIESLGFQGDESQIFRAYKASNHYKSRGKFWNDGKRETLLRYINLTFIGIFQGTIAYFTNYIAKNFIDAKFDRVTEVVVEGSLLKAFFILYYRQLLFAAWASSAVMIEPMSGGSGIPEVKCFLNGIDLPRINDFKTGVCKILGVIGSVSAGLPVGKEGPMVHSGAVVAATVSRGRVRDDKTRRDYVAAGAAAGVCTAFSAPIGGFLFAFEEGASYWSQSLTFRTFYTSGWAIATLYILNTVGIRFHKIGFDKLFSFGNFIFEGSRSSYEIWELLVFILLGILGGLIGAIFNDTNERLTHWRIKHVNHTKWRRFAEVLTISSMVSIMMFAIPYIWQGCMPLPSVAEMSSQEEQLVGHLNQFTCDEGFYNPVASLFLADGNDAIKLLFHMHERTFPFYSLILFFTVYISLATITYGIAVPSGLFVPSLLAGAAFGRLFGNLIYKVTPYNVAFSNVYSLIGAAAVLGGMARMTISLTVILLECTGNEQYVLPLMISLFTARVVGSLFNTDLYHIHIHLKKGVQFLDHELRSIGGQHNLYAGHIMSREVVFVRPIERVSVVYDILTSTSHSQFPVIDTEDRDVLYGTINSTALCMLLQARAYGAAKSGTETSVVQTHVQIDPFDEKYVPLVPYKILEREYTSPKIEDIRIDGADRELYMDLRPYCNTAPHTIQETTTVNRAYELFRALGLRILIVTNRYNQCVGVISRDDITNEALAQDMITKGKHL
jgi:chloride channel 7